jgi:hypothetical protein
MTDCSNSCDVLVPLKRYGAQAHQYMVPSTSHRGSIYTEKKSN